MTASGCTQAQALADGSLTPRREVPLRYAIGKYFDDLGHYPQAFAQFQRANELTRAYRSEHDRPRLTRAVDACIMAYPRAEPPGCAAMPAIRRGRC